MMTQEPRVILFFVLAVLALAFPILGLILRHHWQKYAPDKLPGQLLQMLYWVIGGMLLAVMITAYFTSSI